MNTNSNNILCSYIYAHIHTIIELSQFEIKSRKNIFWEDGSEIGRSGVHFPCTPVKRIADLTKRGNSQRYSSIYEDLRPKIEDIERSDGKKSA